MKDESKESILEVIQKETLDIKKCPLQLLDVPVQTHQEDLVPEQLDEIFFCLVCSVKFVLRLVGN